jgi:hypothetical protein
MLKIPFAKVVRSEIIVIHSSLLISTDLLIERWSVQEFSDQGW